MEKALIVFSRAPGRGGVKTRLVPPLSRGEAEELHRRFTTDMLRLAEGINSHLFLATTRSPEAEELARGFHARIMFQRGRHLGERMRGCFSEVFSSGYSSAVMVGTDIPTLPSSFIRRAFEELEETQVVIGPSTDGGYYLLGLKRPYRGLFGGIEWGGSRVLSQTLSRIRALGIKPACLPPWYDVDDGQDLAFLYHHLRCLRACGAEVPPSTYQFLRGMEL